VDDKHRLDRWDEHARYVRVGLPRAKDKDVLDVEVGARKGILYGYDESIKVELTHDGKGSVVVSEVAVRGTFQHGTSLLSV
jgi:hypothetical protein